ncbi:MAG: hypothetical protein JO197_04015 [Acidobacteria bacterium]|nr:hypothetical protein [Acidobacteriota bacterium]MBV9476448.1 hypothetical protein [Acidobacteriota bacterium]
MNYDLAMMALEGLARAPLAVRSENGELVIEAEAASFKELARLCLLLGGTNSTDDEFELSPGVHVEGDSPRVRLRLRAE